jgi:hypothetical protein
MTKRDLIEAYIRGDVDRRQFVSRLTMLGVSGGAAVAYATSLGQGAMAGPAKPQAGYVMRAQATDDGDYGIIVDLIEALQAVAAAIQDLILAVLSALSQFASGDFGPGQFETLQTVQNQQQEHLDAVNALLTANGGAAAGATRLGFQTQQFASPDEFLTALSEGFEKLTANYAGVVPAVDNLEARTTLMSVASVANRHASVVNNFAGVPEFPNTFQPAEVPEV